MSVKPRWFPCPACGSVLGLGFTADTSEGRCMSCRRTSSALLFPRAFAASSPPPIGQGPPPLPGAAPGTGDAVCFYDPNRKATCLCDQCGVLISDAWAADWGKRKICLRCLDKLRTTRRDRDFESTRVLWDNIALLLSMGTLNPVIPFITAPAALFVGLRNWNHPRSLVPRSRFRLVVAIVFSALQIVAGAVFLWAIANEWTTL